MRHPDFTITVQIDKSSEVVFNAVTNVRGWWSEDIEGSTRALNDVFIYHYKDIHLCKIKLIEVVPNQKVAWHILDNHFSFTKDKSEWIDTKISFEITEKGGKTQLRFTHKGLVPTYECYNICEEAWTNYITNSLRNLALNGKGQPNPKDGEGYNTDLAKKWKLE